MNLLHRNSLAGIVAIVCAGGLTFPTIAFAAPTARLVSCGEESCLLIKGYRDDAASAVSINDHVVAVEGGRSWRVRMTLATVRLFSEPYARSLSVTVARPDGQEQASDAAMLPIGLMGHVTNLASLVVSVH